MVVELVVVLVVVAVARRAAEDWTDSSAAASRSGYRFVEDLDDFLRFISLECIL